MIEFIAISGLFGLMTGSFAGMLVYRLMANESLLAKSRSFCPECRNQLKWYHNIPVVSWIAIRGHCAFCDNKISWHYPVIETLMSILFMVFAYLHMGDYPETARMFILTFLLLVASFTDIMSGYIYDKITYTGIAIGLSMSFLDGGITQQQAFIGTVFGFGSLWGLNAVYKAVRGVDGMGWGDFKLMAMIGAFIGFHGAVYAMAIGPIVGLVVAVPIYMTRKPKGGFAGMEITFGQYLALGAVCIALGGVY